MTIPELPRPDARSRKPKRSFFAENADKFNALAAGLRECQIGAFCAVRAHFSVSKEPCVISLPTGSGKTGLMMALAFGLKANRVLVISPAEVLRTQTGVKFRKLEELRNAGALPALGPRSAPKVYSIESERRRSDNWDELGEFDVVTATTRTTSPGMANIAKPPPELFDVVFFDEAHHAAAATWTALIHSFDLKRTKIILLTGTPYRRDNQSIGPAPRFVYPIQRAIEDGIYAPVGLVTAGSPPRDSRDSVLSELGEKQLRYLRRKSSAKLLILAKTDRKSHADELQKIYAGRGLKLGLVHSDRSRKQNEQTIEEAREGRSDGLIVVGMLGEGLDIPALKVAVFHRNPQSLPYTLQIIGRIARTKPDLAEAKVIACADDFTRETFRLFEGSEDWLRLIPELEELLIDRLAPRFRKPVSDTGAEIELADVSTHFSLTVHRVDNGPRKSSLADMEFKFQRGWIRVVVDKAILPGLRVVVTRAEELPKWLRLHGSSAVTDLRYQLHVFFTGVPDLVIQQSTDEPLADLLREKIVGRGKPVPPGKLNHILAATRGEYIVVGLKNGSATSGLQPSYKMLMGQRADGSITSTDRRNCHAGHCVTRIGTGADAEFRGIAYKKSRVWTLERDNLRVLGDWMRVVAEAVRNDGLAVLPNLELLRQPQPLIEFPSLPVAVIPPVGILDKKVVFSRDSDQQLDGFPWIDPITKGKRRLSLSIPKLGTRLIAEIKDGGILLRENGTSAWEAQVTGAPDYSRRFSLENFFNEFAPTLIFEDGSSWADGVFTLPCTAPVLSSTSLVATSWVSCDTLRELPSSPRKGDSIHEFVERLTAVKGTVVVRDHASGEVADYIAFDSASQTVTFYHCKGAATMKPGVDQENVRELVTQAMTGCRWVKNPNLCSQLTGRMRDYATTVVVNGSSADWAKIVELFDASTWRFVMTLVQPGVASKKVMQPGGQRLERILACTEDYIRGAGAEMRLLCS